MPLSGGEEPRCSKDGDENSHVLSRKENTSDRENADSHLDATEHHRGSHKTCDVPVVPLDLIVVIVNSSIHSLDALKGATGHITNNIESGKRS